ncbi:hypothetical protein A6E15_18705 [Natrinema saccharevitans]|uniref:Uncharacterized protein n=1 Tax=Natrinema saccharevitans TaxID=301967 RepID=A0A1S8AS82_9EURY|nr:hypothetical protein A6E15_18705 [Natrinema saccharevitans]
MLRHLLRELRNCIVWSSDDELVATLDAEVSTNIGEDTTVSLDRNDRTVHLLADLGLGECLVLQTRCWCLDYSSR